MRTLILVACFWLATSPLWGKIAFHSKRDGLAEIYTMDSDGGNLTRLTFNEESDAYPVWSPNGRQIAFSSSRDKNREVYVMDADGSNQRNLSNQPGYDSFADWSPDGSQIVFVSDRNGGENFDTNIFVMDADGGNVKQITHLAFTGAPRWSPDGKQIAFETDDFEVERQVYVMDIDGGNMWRVSSPKANTAMILEGWSPDGTQILYTEAIESRSDKATPVIATLNLGRREVIRWKRVPVPKGPFDTGDFSADGKSILFAGWWTGDWDIYRFVLADRQLIQLTDSPGRDAGPHESAAPLSVRPKPGRLPVYWGEIKAAR